MTDPATTIREALDSVPHRVEGWKDRYRPALAALTELEQQLAEATLQANGWRAIAEDADGVMFVTRAEAAERERDHHLETAEYHQRAAAQTFDELREVKRERDQLRDECKVLRTTSGWERARQLAALAIPIVNKLIDGSYGRDATVTKQEIDALRAALDRQERA